MKINSLVSIILFLIPIYSQAQNYRTINKDITYLFIPENPIKLHGQIGDIFWDEEQFLSGVKIDSIKYTDTDTTLFFQREFYDDNNQNDWCIKDKYPSLIGKCVIQKNNGIDIYFNINNDSIFINTKAKLNESWIMYKYSDGNYIEAIVDKIDTLNILGIIDSVKYISIVLKNEKEIQIENELNNKELIISKNVGFVKSLNLRDFPYFEDSYEVQNYFIYRTNIHNNTTIPSIGEVYDFDIGDEFHYSYHYDEGYNDDFYKIRKTILDKSIVDDTTLIYRIKNIYTGYKLVCNDELEYECYRESYGEVDTTQLIIKNYNKTILKEYFSYSSEKSINQKMPFEKIKFNEYDADFSVLYFSYNNRLVVENSLLTLSYLDDTCALFNYLLIDCIPSFSKYALGLGKITSHDICNSPGYKNIQSLVYYKKSDGEWGKPLSTNNNYEKLTNKIKIYPNPNNGIFYINFEDNYYTDASIKIIDITGKTIYSNNNLKQINQIDISHSPKGIYLINTVIGNKIYIEKISKQ